MKNILATVCICSMGTLSMAETITWTGNANTQDWATADNWDLNRTPQAGNTIKISSATVTYTSATGTFGNSSTVYEFTDGANVQLGDNTPTTSTSGQIRFDGSFTVGDNSTLSVVCLFAYGTNNVINGTINIYNQFAPGDSNTLTFGTNGQIVYQTGSLNNVEGNNRTTTFNVTLNTGYNHTGVTYELVTRYLFKGAEGAEFKTDKYQTWTITAGTITGSDGSTLTQYSGTEDMTATADNFGQFKLATDTNGVYIQYVHAVVPEPASTAFGLCALLGMCVRRQRR